MLLLPDSGGESVSHQALKNEVGNWAFISKITPVKWRRLTLRGSGEPWKTGLRCWGRGKNWALLNRVACWISGRRQSSGNMDWLAKEWLVVRSCGPMSQLAEAWWLAGRAVSCLGPPSTSTSSSRILWDFRNWWQDNRFWVLTHEQLLLAEFIPLGGGKCFCMSNMNHSAFSLLWRMFHLTSDCHEYLAGWILIKTTLVRFDVWR